MVGAMKNQKGFTLVEAVVVAVIVAVLAIVAGLLYRGYIIDARIATVQNLAETAAASANTYWRKTNNNPAGTSAELIALLNLYVPDQTKYTFAVSGNQITVTDNYSNTKGANFRP